MIQCSVRIKYFAILNKELLISTWAVVAIIFHQTKAWKLFNGKCIMNLDKLYGNSQGRRQKRRKDKDALGQKCIGRDLYED